MFSSFLKKEKKNNLFKFLTKQPLISLNKQKYFFYKIFYLKYFLIRQKLMFFFLKKGNMVFFKLCLDRFFLKKLITNGCITGFLKKIW